MKDKCDIAAPDVDLSWLRDEDPEIYHLLRALDGDLDALRWLRLRGDGLFLFVEALTGAREAADLLLAQPPEKLTDLFDTIVHCDVEDWLREKQPELQRLFVFVRGDETALRGLKHNRATCKRVAEIVREKYRHYHDADGEGAPAPSGDGAAADVGCLIGEMHLQNQEFHKAAEAFGRAIENDPTPDAHDGRARAYRALAALDEHSAAELRARVVR